ncbi:hypothetical protein [Mucilaginibacter ginsenosidivorans]|uniref:Uncharacterized protein n=1 Tax=Mucilaginibacter ginsenosidivorans TaxID=398053 RepID=A0A5B8UTH1_9SPHI|nr:hypothetical protein [Mucilaginibacter ginsenosidivorans]QEC62400.1 hypothetical protein FRZ54_07315 [Mucilaginibacter ginsenosidivorans]
MNIKSYLPINTTAKVDELIAELESMRWDAKMEKVELEVVMEIRKMKIQLYCKEAFLKLRLRKQNQKSTATASSSNAQSATVKELTVGKKAMKQESALCRQFIGLTIAEVAHHMEKDLVELIRVLGSLGADVAADSLFSREIHSLSKDYIVNYIFARNRAIKLKEIETQNQASGFVKKAALFRASEGTEGNYHKLIYTHPKS